MKTVICRVSLAAFFHYESLMKLTFFYFTGSFNSAFNWLEYFDRNLFFFYSIFL